MIFIFKGINNMILYRIILRKLIIIIFVFLFHLLNVLGNTNSITIIQKHYFNTLNFITGMEIDEKYIYVLDRGNHNVVIFDRNTFEILKTIGEKGQGPGEFELPFGFAVAENSIIVSDAQLNRISQFIHTNGSWKFSRTITLPSDMQGIGIIKSQGKKYFAITPKKEILISVLNMDFKLVNELFKKHDIQIKSHKEGGIIGRMTNQAVICVDDNAIYSMYTILPTLHVHNLDGTFKISIDLEVPGFKYIKDYTYNFRRTEIVKFYNENILIHNIFSSYNNIFLSTVTWENETPSYNIYIYNKNDFLLVQFVSNIKYEPFAVTDDGKILAGIPIPDGGYEIALFKVNRK